MIDQILSPMGPRTQWPGMLMYDIPLEEFYAIH